MGIKAMTHIGIDSIPYMGIYSLYMYMSILYLYLSKDKMSFHLFANDFSSKFCLEAMIYYDLAI